MPPRQPPTPDEPDTAPLWLGFVMIVAAIVYGGLILWGAITLLNWTIS